MYIIYIYNIYIYIYIYIICRYMKYNTVIYKNNIQNIMMYIQKSAFSTNWTKSQIKH